MALHPAPLREAATPENADTLPLRNSCSSAMRDAATDDAGKDDGEEFTDLVRMAAQLLDTPIALIAVAEGDYFRMTAEYGYGKLLVPREHVICRAVDHDTPLLVLLDASVDARFCADPAVALDGVRFYLGIALFGSTGLQIGVLAVADFLPRAAVPEDALAMLHRLARLAARLVERRAFERSNRIAEQIAQAAFSAVVKLDAAGMVTSMNAAAQAMFGPAITCGLPIHALFPRALQDDPDAVEEWLCAGVGDARAAPTGACELRVRCGYGELRILEAVRCALLPGETSALALILRDITDSRRLRDVQQNPLTDLPNRDALLAIIAALHAQATPLTVALIGLDNFRRINDALGHAIGDTVLQVVACRMLAQMPADAHLAHVGGDEFAMAFPFTSADAIDAVLHTMLRDLARPCEVDHHRVHLEVSIGLAIDEVVDATTHATTGASDVSERTDAGELLARAGLAMQHAKRAGGQQSRRFEPGMRTEVIDRHQLDLELRSACLEGEFELHYQPQIDLASGLPTGAEALLRWRHPKRGLLLPGAFIDALAHSVIALQIGRWILQRACRDAAAWPAVNGRRLAVGVNLFPVQFDDLRFLDEVDLALALSGLRPEQLEIELTETIALRNDGVAEKVLMQLRARGVRVSFDDFGTGYASLSMLQRLPVDRVKIDRSFVSNVIERRGDEAIVRSITLIARNFDLQVIAEGVETLSQAALLREIGCDEVQGYLYSKALAPVDFDRWLAHKMDAQQAKAPAHG